MKTVKKYIYRIADNGLYAVLWLIIVGLFVILSFSSDVFFTVRNFQSMALQIAPLGLLSLGMMFPIVSGGINLGLVATGNLSCILMAIFYKYVLRVEDVGVAGVIITITMVCLLSGLLTMAIGGMIGYLTVPAILAGLTVQKFADGISLILTKGVAYSRFADGLRNVDIKLILGLPSGIFVLAAIVVLITIIYKYRVLGPQIILVGSNSLASEYCGININRTFLWTYFLSGIFSGLGCFLMAMQFDSVNVGQGDSFILKTVLICVLGGVSPTGGSGKVYGVVLALIILQLVSSGLNILGLVSYVQTSLWGLVVLAVMGIQRFAEYLSQKKMARG